MWQVAQGQDKQRAIEMALLEERSARAGLDLQVRALCAELTRASDMTGALALFGQAACWTILALLLLCCRQCMYDCDWPQTTWERLSGMPCTAEGGM